MAESRGGRGRAARCGSKSLQPAAKPSPRGQTFHYFGQECPWNRSPGTLWFTRMPPPRAGGPRSTGLQCRGFGQVPNCTGISTALTEGTLGTDALAHSWPRGLCKYAFPPVSLLAQTPCKVREEEEQILLVAPYWPTRTWFPELMLLVTAPPWQIPLRKDLLPQRRGTLWHPRPDLWKLHVWSLDETRSF